MFNLRTMAAHQRAMATSRLMASSRPRAGSMLSSKVIHNNLFINSRTSSAIVPSAGKTAHELSTSTSTPRMTSFTLQDRFITSKAQKQLDVIEAIRGDLAIEGISVPGVVVVGAQSAGKSSVLESLSGIQLPRGATITTRVPLLLRLENDPSMQPGEVRARISKTADMSQGEDVSIELIAKKISQFTLELAGEGGGVADFPIHLKIMRKDSPNLTLIDLPGIAYNTSDQGLDGDIAELTKNLIIKYITPPDMIIVVVLPAVDDFGAHESIKLARIHDPTGMRTLGVVTKTDRIESGVDFAAKMRAEGDGHIKLKLGYIAVKNRSQQQVEDGISMEEARKHERDFFENDPLVAGLDNSQWGMHTVTERIVGIQSQTVAGSIPMVGRDVVNVMRKLMTEKIHDLELAASKLPPTFQNESERRAFFIDLVQKLIGTFQDLATTRYVLEPANAHLAVASEIYELYKDFSKKLQEAIPNFLSDSYREKLEGLVRLSRGGSLSNFLSHPVFAACVKEDFVKPLSVFSEYLINDSQKCIIMVFGSLLEVSSDTTLSSTQKASPVPQVHGTSIQLRQLIMQEAMEFLKHREAECHAHMKVCSKAEEFIFTLDTTYGNAIDDLKHEGPQSADLRKWSMIRLFTTGMTDAFVQSFHSGDNEIKALCEMQASLQAYVRIRSRSAADDVAKIIRLFLVQSLIDQLPRHLYANIPDEKLADLMAEDATVARERARISASLERFKRTLNELKRV